MTGKKCLIVVLTLVSCFAWAKGKKRRSKKEGPPKYYFMIPVDAAPEWTYAIPECQEIALEDYKIMKNKNDCQEKENHSDVCLSKADIELKNSKTNEKKNFGLNYVIHNKKEDCQADRAKLVPQGT